MSGFQIRYLGYFGPGKTPASLSFDPGLNVVCGASETGKSYIVESIDFMLGQESPVRDIPEAAGYDRIRLAIESQNHPPLTLDRSVEGGHLRAYDELLADAEPTTEVRQLRFKHAHSRNDTLSYALLSRTGLTSRTLRRSASDTRSLSFRDLARLCVVTEEDIQRSGSPLLSGQFTGVTSEYATFKLLLTGSDDSALVTAKEDSIKQEQDSGKIELLNQMIEELQAELDEEGADENDLNDQLIKLEESIRTQTEALSGVQKTLTELMERRATAAGEIRTRNARLSEIRELVARFQLLDDHYKTDLARLGAIKETGSLFVHLEQQQCPLCGALPGAQHLETDCDGNTEAVVKAADSEMAKVERLRRELADTIGSLNTERVELVTSLKGFREEYDKSDKELGDIAAPAVAAGRSSFNDLVSKRAEVRSTLDKIARLSRLMEQRSALEGQSGAGEGPTKSRTQISKNVLDEFAQTIEKILKEWHFPNATRVFFDPDKKDIQIAGKNRGSTGKGLRAITHAAVTIGLMEFCRDRQLPHPGFVVLDSPLLAYWKPEGSDDDLRGTDLKEMFYRYLLGMNKDSQVIIIENEHPPHFVFDEGTVTVFTKNPRQGRYGFFPHTD